MTTTAKNGARFFMENLTTLRERAGLKINQLARLAEVSRDTISKIERNHPVTVEVLHRVCNALEGRAVKLDRDVEISDVEPGTKRKSSK